MMAHAPDKISTYLLIFFVLLVLTAITVYAAFLDLGLLNIPVALAIAILKATLVVIFFMHLRHSAKLTRLFVASGFFWLVLLFGFTYADYLSRSWLQAQSATSWITRDPSHFTLEPTRTSIPPASHLDH